MENLIIGSAVGYSWNDLQYWVNSIKQSGFTGDVMLVGTNLKKKTIEELTKKGIQLHLYGSYNNDGDIVTYVNSTPHVDRFFYMWNTLRQLKKSYNYIISTDVRDVVFQKNPDEWTKNFGNHRLIASSEGIKYKNEPWGNKNLSDALGPYFHDILKENMIYNVGVLAGKYETMLSLMLMLFQMSINRPIKIVDQAIYNFILNIPIFSEETLFATPEYSWAINLGTTIEAVKASSGDLGKIYGKDQKTLGEYLLLYEDKQPKLSKEGIVLTNNNEPYTIVHQWDRIPHLKEKIEKKYGS